MDFSDDAAPILLEAEKLEAEGRYDEAVKLYRRAFKMNPMTIASHQEGNEGEDLGYLRTPDDTACFRTFDARMLSDSVTRQQAHEYFEAMGFLVLDNVMEDEEVQEALNRFKNFMFVTCEMDIRSKVDLKANFANAAVGFAVKCASGHSSMNWLVRSRPRVKDAFRLALGLNESEKMISSFDGFNYFRNPEADPTWVTNTDPWFHVDAGDVESSHYVQSVVNLIDCTDEADAGLVLLPRSHLTVFPALCPDQKLPNMRGITYLGRMEEALIRKLHLKEHACRIPLKAGSMALWKSATLHCNTGCLPRKSPNPEQLIRRLAIYVCMMKDNGDPEVAAKRQEAFAEGRSTCHQPDLVRCVGDHAQETSVAANVVFTSVDKLPEGAAELL